jgi:hypothetical protein
LTFQEQDTQLWSRSLFHPLDDQSPALNCAVGRVKIRDRSTFIQQVVKQFAQGFHGNLLPQSASLKVVGIEEAGLVIGVL